MRFKDEQGEDYAEWEEKRLGELVDYEQPNECIVNSTEYDDSYKLPVLTAGKSFILGYTNEKENVFNDRLPVIIFDDFTTATQFVDFSFKVKSSAMKILISKKNENIKFIYEMMQQIRFEIGGHGRHWISIFSKISIPYPTLPEQQKIADFLLSLDNLIESKQAQISKAEEWKKGVMQGVFV
ncbi:MAG: restriction endonuclease subunit S [Candidatus Dojkabacteria bacterium]|nr:restriction endonuclease subunit S [Candidatus Dojkabacteria bacterium]MDQ7020764.1 restriction endonuclease subunit S [Candidatus Dojkabacteria bacterium]